MGDQLVLIPCRLDRRDARSALIEDADGWPRRVVGPLGRVRGRLCVAARWVREVGDREAAAWVGGETLGWDGPAGWALVSWNGWPLGWGRGSGATLKNHYPKGLRTMRPAHA